MQIGVEHERAASKAQAQGVDVVMNRCPKIEYQRLFRRVAHGWVCDRGDLVETLTVIALISRLQPGDLLPAPLFQNNGAWNPVIPRIFRQGCPVQHAAISPWVQNHAFIHRFAFAADDCGAVVDPERIVGVGDCAVHGQGFEILLVEALFDIFGPVPAQPSRAQSLVDLGVVNKRRIGDFVLAGQLCRIGIGNISGAPRFGGVNIRPQALDLGRKAVDIVVAGGGAAAASREKGTKASNAITQRQSAGSFRRPLIAAPGRVNA